jgi:hypothetical protein
MPRTWKGWLGYGIAALVLIALLTPDSNETAEPRAKRDTVKDDATQAAPDAEAARADRAALRRERAKIRRQRAQLRRERAQIRRQRARARRLAVVRRARRREIAAAEAAAAAPEPQPAAEPVSNCHPSYDPCLDPNASDYDCDGGSGDGPNYTGFVTVTGPDDYGLDSDGDGTGCES